MALGASAMQLNSTGASNTAVGVTAGAYAFNGGTSINNTTSSFSLFLGRDTKPDNIGQTNQIVIGYLANGIGSNSVVLGNDSITKTALKGNVGIGTTAPGAKLTVITPFNNYPTDKNPVISLRQSTDNTFGFDWIQDGQNTGDLHLHRVNSGVSNHVLAITRGAGNVGIGTTAPTTPLTIQANSGGSAFNILGSYGNFLFQCGGVYGVNLSSQSNTSTDGFLLGTDSGSSNAGAMLRLQTKGVTRAVIDYLGNVGIGTTSPTSKLHVAGNSSPGIAIENTVATGYSELLFKNTVATGSSIFLNGSAQSGYGGNSSLNIYSSNGPLAFHTATVTNALSIAQSGTCTHAGNLIFAPDNTYDIGASGATRPRNVYVAGLAVVGSSLGVGGDLTVGDTKLLGWISGRSIMSSPADGYIRFTDSFQTNFNRLQFGGTSASFPALKRVGTDLQVVVANTTAAIGVAAGDADLTFIEDRYRRKGTGTPEAAVTAPIGAVYHRTDGGAGTSFYVKESGTGNTGWVGK